MRLYDYLKNLKDPLDMTPEELLKARSSIEKFTKNAKVTIKLDDLMDVIATNEATVNKLINDMNIDDDLKYLMVGIFTTYCDMILMGINEKGETIGIKQSTKRY